MLKSILSASKHFRRPQTVVFRRDFCQNLYDNKHETQKVPANHESKLLIVLNGIDNWDVCR